ncbi:MULTISPECIES: HAD hydrolase-like protein [unclassified Spirosoma]|uniref:HAD hydrolase-like protein n=1 Tax=unclassified Spirosoma TaxID=2621999 RepID=UPI0009664DE7|nr:MULTISPECIES: HAD hydrolase-like protein [unclassified Spirosoma]MBN8822031.1 HAD hydrolase-like protein [Spirosoma sp.]OJW80440.1 MAG: HAD family hydrolase [Spirosoma sp. 48-14]
MANFKLVIFDFDGTLADSFPFFLRTFNRLVSHYQFKRIEPEDVDRLRGLDVRQMINYVGIPAWRLPFVARKFIRLMGDSLDQIQLFDQIRPLLKQLSAQGVQLAIVSSNSEENIRRVLGPEIASLIRYYRCGTAIFGKSRQFRKVATQSRISPRDILCVGDEVRDMEAAEAEKMAFGAVTWGYTRSDVFSAYANIRLFHTVDDICRAVLGKHLTID